MQADGFTAASPFARRPLAPLALTLGLHLLLVLAWLGGGGPGGHREPAERASTFVLVRPTFTPAQPSAAARLPQRRTRAASSGAAAAPVATQVPAHVSPPVPAQTPATEPVASAPGATDAAAALDEAPASPLPGELLFTSKRMAGGVDRELRNGSSPITAEPDRKWERFAEMVAGARSGASRDTVLESHTAADGVIVYRKTVGNRVRCYRSGSAGGLGPADGRSAGSISCPIGVSWTRR